MRARNDPHCRDLDGGVPKSVEASDKHNSSNMQLEKKIRQFVDQNLLFGDSRYHYNDDSSFLQSGIVDSIAVMELAEFAASAFGVQVDPMDVTPENFDSVRGLAAFLRRKLGTNPA
jgi:acyl carrier protein